jgi:iron-sulfur cluster assembly accessory protein
MNPIIVTDNACKAFLENLQSDGSENKYIRVSVKGGGCSGLQYLLDVAEKPENDDIAWEKGGVRFVLDEFSRPYLEGMTIDYGSGLQNSGFQFLNPKSTRTCGCGSSFSV